MIDQGNEFIPTHTPDRITRPQRCHHAVRHLKQHLIPHRVAEPIIDFLEMIQIDQQQGKALTAACRTQRQLLITIGNQLAIRQMGQDIMGRQISRALVIQFCTIQGMQVALSEHRHHEKGEHEQQGHGKRIGSHQIAPDNLL